MNTELLMWIALYITLVTLLFNLLKSVFKLNLPSTIILTTSVSFLMTTGAFNESFRDWFAYYIWAIIILAALVTIIYVTAIRGCKMSNPKADTNLKEK